MSDDLLLDTHTWLWMAPDYPSMPSKLRAELDQAAHEKRLFLSAISLAEVAYLVARRRITLSMSLPDWFHLSLRDPLIQILPLTPEIAAAPALLPDDFHGDPGDRLIAATAQVHELTLCTHDHALFRFGKRGVFRFLEV